MVATAIARVRTYGLPGGQVRTVDPSRGTASVLQDEQMSHSV